MTGLLKAVRQQGKGRRLSSAALTVSAAILAALSTGTALAAISTDSPIDALITSKLPAKATAHELRDEITRKGREGIELAARLHETGGLIRRPVRWIIRRTLLDQGKPGELVLMQSAPILDTGLEPGEYLIEAEYGYHRLSQAITIEPGHKLGLTLILNVGGIRALSKLDKLDLPRGTNARQAVYVASGPDAGKLVATTSDQGEVLRLGAGTYKVESRIYPGNTIALHTITVKPGVLSSMELAHQAGLVRVTVGKSYQTAVAWEVRKLDGSWLSGQTVPEASLVLAPGAYEVVAIVNGSVERRQFTIKAGDNQHIRLGFGS